MTAYQERELLYEQRVRIGFEAIERVAQSSPYPNSSNGKQFVDFQVGGKDDKVQKVRVLIDFRGECFSSFIVEGKSMPIDVISGIRNALYFSASEAYDSIISITKNLNAQ